ncbi:MAG: AMP-binding protein [Oscillospiraceae bacterium]|jgi:acetyl-CoA synthetase|nr:AMP-binding protein [Oscillospiraceae bacterium]
MYDLNKFNEQFVVESYDEQGVLTEFSPNLKDNFNFAYDVVDEIAKIAPDKQALIWIGNDGEEKFFTYKDLSEKSNQIAHMFLEHGVKKGDMFVVVLKRHWQIWVTVLALEKIGAVLIPATNQLQPKDYVYRFKSGNVKYVVATPDNNTPQHMEDALKEYDGIKEKFVVKGARDGWIDFDTEFEKYPKDFERIENKTSDVSLAFFSSGTTGYPKLVTHSHDYSVAHLLTAKHWHNAKSHSIHLTISESGWGKFFWGKIFGEFLMGSTVFAYDFDRFDSLKLLEYISKYKVTSLCCPPTMLNMFIKGGLDKKYLTSVEYVTTAGEALKPDVFNKFKELTGITIYEGFGQTETVLSIGVLVGQTPKPGSMGKPVPLYNLDIVDTDGNSVPRGETGEIVIRMKDKNPGLFLEYYGNDDATAETKKDGIYHTGDTAWEDTDGYYWYVGRTDDVIKASGYRIGPVEIEAVLAEHPAVYEVAVVPAPDPVRGQVVRAVIVPTEEYKEKIQDPDFKTALIKELQTHVKNQTAPYKYPRIIDFIDALPKTISGKIQRNLVR